MDKDKKRPKAYKTIAIRVTALCLSIWLVFMLVLTWAVAKDFYTQLDNNAMLIAKDYHVGYGTQIEKTLPGYEDMIRINRLGEGYWLLRTEKLLPFVLPQTPNVYGSDDWFYGNWELMFGFQPAVIFYDQDRNILMQSGNVMSFTYCTEENWKAENPEVTGIGWVDLDAIPESKSALSLNYWGGPHADTPSQMDLFGWSTLRMTGWFEENQFFPVLVDKGLNPDFDIMEAEGIARMDAAGQIRWENMLSGEIPEGKELVTLYSWETGGYEYEHQAVTAGGRQFDSLVELLHADLVAESSYGRENLFDSIIIYRGNTLEDDPEVGLYALAIRCWPMKYAALRLIPTYLVSFALVAVSLWLILRSIKRNLTDTVEMLVQRLVTDAPIGHLSGWKEPYALEAILQGEQEQRRALVNDNQKLKASLDFAKNAEENRRQLVSNITHELKTPLAIVHSYAEGLQSGIAEGKKEKYLSTILEETERMDAMVLEMLDHSRLEAGKVRLSADHFSLLTLAESIVEKLTPALEGRDLSLSWGFCNECRVTADEARISQVVTNLLTNAIRYTDDGGEIWLRIFSDANDACFQIENYAGHMPEETLEKIFETFYRADDSRTGKGTGLGLPIARSIIELHRGTLTAKNTWVNGQSCILFQFSIPLK